jgi:hypothetical protein
MLSFIDQKRWTEPRKNYPLQAYNLCGIVWEIDLGFLLFSLMYTRAPRGALSITTWRIRLCRQSFPVRRTENIILPKLHMCKSIKIKVSQNYEATAGTRTTGQLKCTNMRYLTVTLARIASESSRAPSRPGTRYRLFNGKAVYPHPGLKSPTQSKTIANLRVRERQA